MDSDREATARRPSNDVIFKILVPSVAAGAIIGKGGEAIAQVQKDFGAKVKMSKANDFYPGTTERVCLIQGSVESISSVCNYIMEKVMEKPDPNPKLTGDGKLNVERHKQVKILVPNSTAGMIIGKKGSFIKEMIDSSGAYVQVSQKPKEQSLTERCVTVAGDAESTRSAVGQILAKIAEDPQSGNCPNISYSDVSGPVASAYPTGSPFAAVAGVDAAGCQLSASQTGGIGVGSFSRIGADSLRGSLSAGGYSDSAADEIIGAIATLAGYGFFNFQSLLQSSGPATPLPPVVASPHSSLSLPPGTLAGLQLSEEFGHIGERQQQQQQQHPAFIFSHFDSSQPPFDKSASTASTSGQICKRELEAPESLVGVVIGPGGKDIIELQNATQTSIQVSKRADQLPGNRQRTIVIAGLQSNVLKAERIIQHRLSQEDQRRQHQN